MRQLVILGLSVLSCGTASTAYAADLPFETYESYFISNRFEPNADESFVVITSQRQFDEVFGVAMVMNDKSRRLPKDLFKSSIVVAVINRGSSIWRYKVESVTMEGGVVQFKYTSKTRKSTAVTLTFAYPLIVSIPQGTYTAVEFVENKKLAKRIDLTEK
jgi:hypothetical protein